MSSEPGGDTGGNFNEWADNLALGKIIERKPLQTEALIKVS